MTPATIIIRVSRSLCLTVALALAGSAAMAAPGWDHRAEADSLAGVFSHPPTLVPGPNASLDDYLRIAAHRSPALRSAFYRWQGALERSGYVGAMPNPTVSFTHFIESVETRVGPQEQKVALSQQFPWFGTLDARKENALAAAQAQWQSFQAEKLGVFFEVKSAWYDYYYLGRQIAITKDNVALLGFWESVARTKYEVALSQHTDVIKAQVELVKLEDQLETYRDRIAPAAARLRAAVSLPPDVELPIPASIEVDEAPIDHDRTLSRIHAGNPDLKSLLHRIESSRSGVRVAGKSSWPNLTLAVDYIATGPARMPLTEGSGKDPVTVSVGISIPLWIGANAARKREATAMLHEAEYSYDHARERIDAVVEEVLYEHAEALRKTALYRDGLVPKAQQSISASYTAYQAGETSFLSLLDTQRQLLEFELVLERMRSNLAIRRAEIEMLMGQGLSNSEE